MFSRLSRRIRNCTIRLLGIGAGSTLTESASAAVYGGSLKEGILILAGVGDIASNTSIRGVILTIVAWALKIILLVAVVVIIIAGIYLVVSNGEDSSKDKAKKIVLYCIIGIALILFARVIVVVVNNVLG